MLEPMAGRERGIQRMMPCASALRSQGLGAARTGGSGRRRRAWGAASGLGRPRGTKQPLFHLCPALGLFSTMPACTQQLPAPECICKATGEENVRGPGQRDGVDGCTFWPQLYLAGPGCSWALTPGSRAWPAARCLLSVLHCSGVPSGWDSAAAMSPGSHPQQGGQEKERSHEM